MSKSQKEIQNMLKQIRDIEDDDVIEIVTQQPKKPSPYSSLDIFKFRRQQSKPKQTSMIDTYLTQLQAKKNFKNTVNVDQIQDKKLKAKELFDKKFQREVISIEQKPKQPKISQKEKRDEEERFKKQLKIVNRMNVPSWEDQKKKVSERNYDKYRLSSIQNKQYEQQPEIRTFTYNQKGKESKNSIRTRNQVIEGSKKVETSKRKIEKDQKKKEEEDRKFKQKMQDYDLLLQGMVNMEPSKKFITNDQEEQIMPKHPQVRRRRVPLNEYVKPDEVPFFIKNILRYDYTNKQPKPITKKIPDFFESEDNYKKIFQSMVMNQSIADLHQRLRKVQNKQIQPIRIRITNSIINTDGLLQISFNEVEKPEKKNENADKKKERFEVKNYSLSKYRLGLITNDSTFRLSQYGLPGKDKDKFSFFCMLITPSTKEDLSSDVKATCCVRQHQLNRELSSRNHVYYFDMQKLTTNIRQYEAISNIINWELLSLVLQPTLLEKEKMYQVDHKERLDPILNQLQHKYNKTQFESIKQMVLRQSGIVLLQGPPGTGKTSTLLGLLAAQYEYMIQVNDNRKIMICAPSNAAVNHIAKRIITEGVINGEGQILKPVCLRTGIVDTDDTDILSISLDNLCDKELIRSSQQKLKDSKLTTPQIKEKIIILQKELRKLNEEHAKTDDRLQIEQMEIQIKKKKDQLIVYDGLLYQFRTQKVVLSKKNYSQIEAELLMGADIILTTLASSGNDKLNRIRGDIACLIVDEAAQATEPNLLIAFQSGVDKVLLVGDPCQLPSTCMNSDANSTLFNRSLFERFIDAGIKPYFLDIQYRMSPNIRQFPSATFYQNRLKDSPTISKRQIPQILKNFQKRGVIFIDAILGEQKRNNDSYYNSGEGRIVRQLIVTFQNQGISIGVITPYSSQRKLIVRNEIQNIPIEKRAQFEKLVKINTVDSFQGQEKDVIIISTVRANPGCSLGFLMDKRRINVALTRSKFLVIVIGSGNTLGSSEIWDNFLSWVESKKLYYQIDRRDKIATTVEAIMQGQEGFNHSNRTRNIKKTKDDRKYHWKAPENNNNFNKKRSNDDHTKKQKQQYEY